MTPNFNTGTTGAGPSAAQQATMDAQQAYADRFLLAVKNAATYMEDAARFQKEVDDEMKRRAEASKIISRDPASAAPSGFFRRNAFAFRDAARGARDMVGGGGAAGLLGKAGPYGAAAAAALQTLDIAVQRATKAVNTFTNAGMTSAQKWESLKDDVIPFFSTIRKFGEALDGTAEAIRKAGAKLAHDLAVQSVSAANRATLSGFAADTMDPFRATVRAGRARGALPGMQTYDRASAIGAEHSREQDITLPAADAARRAKLTADAAKEELFMRSSAAKSAAVREQRSRAESQAAYDRVQAIQKSENSGGGRDKAGKATAIGEAQAAFDRQQKDSVALETELNRVAQATVKAKQAEAEAQRAVVDQQKAELQLLQQKEQRMAGYAQKLGSMNEADFEMAKEALKAVKENGLENLPAEIADQAAQIAPEFIAKQREALGGKRARDFAGGDGKGIDDSLVDAFGKETLAQVRANVDKVKADVRVTLDLDPVLTAEAIVDKLGPVLGDLKKALDVRLDMIERKVELDRIQRVEQGQ